jgi:hypothetical protein
MAAALESLFALYSRLWLRNLTGTGSDLFTTMVKHFTARKSYELTLVGQIQSVLTKAQLSIFNKLHKKYAREFRPGSFASCDFFIDSILKPSNNPTRALDGLFSVTETREFSCDNHGQSPKPLITNDTLTLVITQHMFERNDLNCSDLQKPFNLWTAFGLYRATGLVCRTFLDLQPNSDKVKLTETSTLQFPNGLPPAHLYITLDVVIIPQEEDRYAFMGNVDFPLKLTVACHTYTLMSRGFWNGTHY